MGDDIGLMVQFDNGSSDVVADQFTLVRLGSVTHQFDMDQRFLWLDINGGILDEPNVLEVARPDTPNHAPPGYYMLFLRTEGGEVSTGEYIKLTTGNSMVYVCPAAPALTAAETSCTAEPVSGQCPDGAEQGNPVALPLVNGPAGPVAGWHVLVPAGEIDDPLALTSEERAGLNARCGAACLAHWASNPALGANCADTDAFYPPQHFFDGAAGPYDLVLPTQKSGQGVFTGQTLACQLDSTCCTAFDEDICAAVPDRTTPANDLLGTGQEYRVALGSPSTVEILAGSSTYSSALTGSAGYSFCRDGNTAAPCPFYLGSFDALATSNITARLICADNTTTTETLSNLVVKLSQPAFGIASQGPSTSKGFPRGGLIFESSFDIGRRHFSRTRPSAGEVVLSASGTSFSASNLLVTFAVPCNDSTATITARFAVSTSPTGGALGAPPAVTNTTAVTGTCGASRALTATIADPNGDAGPVRWRVDGVLMAPGTSVPGHFIHVILGRDPSGVWAAA